MIKTGTELFALVEIYSLIYLACRYVYIILALYGPPSADVGELSCTLRID